MDFETISKLVFHGIDLPDDATLTDHYCYTSLRSLNYQYRNKIICKDQATKQKILLIRQYEDQKKMDETRKERLEQQLDCIRKSELLRMKLNKAAVNQEMTKALFLEAVECIGLMCGNMSQYDAIKQQLEGVNYEEQESFCT